MIKKFLFIISLCCLIPGISIAEEPSSKSKIALLKIGNTIYYTKESVLRKVFTDMKDDPCIQSVFSNSEQLWENLYNSCMDNVANVRNEIIKRFDETPVVYSMRGSLALDRKLPGDFYDKYIKCLLDNKKLKAQLNKLNKEISFIQFDTDLIGECIDSANKKNTKIKDLKNLKETYFGKTFDFKLKSDTRVPEKVLIFNGEVLIACNKEKIDHIIDPAFAGQTNCQSKKYNGIPGVGPTPDGVYMVRKGQIQKMNNLESWGGYRVPLIPAKQTQTFGRAAMYIHGTNVCDKRESNGCISVGTQIESFINTGWIDRDVPVIVKMKK